MTVLAKPTVNERAAGLWTADRFLDFYVARPDEERWQLVDGLPMMMNPPNKVHQRLARNLERLLDGALSVVRPELLTYREIGVRIPGNASFGPEPDVAVLPADATYTYYDERVFLVAEVISPSNTAEMVARKIELYQSHPDNLYCLTVDQDSVHVTLWAREDDWTRTDLRSLDDVLKLPAFSFEAPLADIYDGTLLAGRANDIRAG
jgi:Uma2 family endonuclease